jgi:cytochrome c-type biogenesis protein CcmE
MKKSVILPILIACLGLGGAVVVFSGGSTPYVTISEAKKMNSDRINLGLEIDKSTIQAPLRSNKIEFEGTDKNGEKIHVKYIGDPVDLSSAERVTCIGKLEGDQFVSDKMLIKCPSKYEEEQAAKEKAKK